MVGEQKSTKLLNLVAVLAGIFALFLQIFPPQTAADQQKNLMYFFLVLALGILVFAANLFWSKIREYLNSVELHTKELTELKQTMAIERQFHEVDKRIALLERLSANRRAALDINPAWLFFILLLVVFFFYLRSLGII